MVTILATVFGGQVGISSIRVGLANATAQAGATLAEEQANANATAQVAAKQQSNARATAQAEAEQQSIGRATAQIEAEQQSNARATAQVEGEQQAIIARSGELIAQSVAVRSRDLSLSLLLGVEAFRVQTNLQTLGVLMDNLYADPQPEAYLSGHTDTVTSVAFSPDGKSLASGSHDQSIILWNVETRKSSQKLKGPFEISV